PGLPVLEAAVRPRGTKSMPNPPLRPCGPAGPDFSVSPAVPAAKLHPSATEVLDRGPSSGGRLCPPFRGRAPLLPPPSSLLPRPIGRGVALVVGGLVLLLPLLIPPGRPLLRFFAAVAAVIVVVKLYDIHLESRRASRPSFIPFASFLGNPFSLVRRRLTDE